MQFVAKFWSDNEAVRFAQQLDRADRSQFPTIADLMQDQAGGRLPRLRKNGRTGSHGFRQVAGPACSGTSGAPRPQANPPGGSPKCTGYPCSPSGNEYRPRISHRAHPPAPTAKHVPSA